MAEVLTAASRREIRRLIINVPPGHMKSLTCAVFWPTWTWATRPETRWLCGSYSQPFATRDSLKCRRLIDSEWYRRRWGQVYSLTTDQNVKTWFENNRTGYRYVFSTGGGPTGMRADIIVYDDPIDIEDRNSEAARAAVIELQDMTLTGRFRDPKTGVEVVVMQRVHEKDLAGHLLAQGGWEHLCLPAEYEPKHPFVWPDDKRTDPGELLWPDHVGRVELEEQKRRYASAAAGMLQQRPAPAEGALLKRHWWRYFDPAHLEEWRLDPLHAIIVSWDTTFKDKTSSDFCVGTAWGARGADRYLLRLRRERANLPETKTMVREMHRWVEAHFPNLPHSTVVENAANGPEVVAELRSEISGLTTWRPLAHGRQMQKVERVHAVSPQIESGNVHLPGAATGSGDCDPTRTPAWVQEFVAECAVFDNGMYDDQVDSLTLALLKFRGRIDRRPVGEERNGDQALLTADLRTKVF